MAANRVRRGQISAAFHLRRTGKACGAAARLAIRSRLAADDIEEQRQGSFGYSFPHRPWL